MEQIKIDIVPVGVAPVVHASQFDNGRQIRFNLFNQGTPYTLTGAETVTMVVNGEEENITNTSDNYVIWDVAEEDCAEAGVIGCEIRIVLGSMLIGSKNFFLEVEMDPYNGKNIRIVTVGPADICSFETTLPEPYQSVTVNVVATGGNGTPDNPNPINGYSSANITRCGVNLYSDIFSEYRKPVNYYIKNIPLKVGTTYTIKAELKSGGTPQTNVAFGVANKGEQYSEFDSRVMCITIGGTTSTITFTPTSAWTSPKLICYVSGETEFEDVFDNYEITLVEGSSATYTPYNGTTHVISFGQTVYGGVLDVTRGKLTVTHGLYTFTGNEIEYIQQTNRVAVGTNIQAKSGSASCSHFANVLTGSTRFVYIPTSMTSNELRTFMQGNTVTLCYELATPFDIDLTPVQIRALVGENNVFADCGETEVEYMAEV